MVLDYIENIRYERSISPNQNIRSVLDLRYGIILAASNLHNIEKLVQQNSDGESLILDFKVNHRTASVANLFNWFSVNLLSFASCCALIDFVQKEGKQPEAYSSDNELIKRLKAHKKAYIDSIPELKPIQFFRNKSGAHLAYTDPRKDDNPATLLESLDAHIGYACGHFETGMISRGRGAHKSEYSNHPWSVTKTFDALRARYRWDYSEVENA